MILFRRIVTVVVVLAAVALGVLFALRNSSVIPVDFLAFTASASTAAWLVGAFVVGGLLGLSLNVGLFLRMKRGERRAVKQLRQRDRELDKLRSATAGER